MIILRRLYILIFTLFFFGISFAETNDSLFLWQMKTRNSFFYFFGSFHVATKDVYPLDERINSAYSSSSNLIVEVDTSKIDMEEFSRITMAKGSYTNGDSLTNHILVELQKKLSDYFSSFGIPFRNLFLFKPWVLETMATMLLAERSGYSGENGLDVHFIVKAVEDHKNITGLETAGEQLDFFNEIPEDTQIRSLKTTIEDTNAFSAVDKLLAEWKDGNISNFTALLYENYEKYPELQPVLDVLFTKRNKNWVEKIRQLDEKGGSYFLVAGAGHFAGKDNIIELLRKEGYEVIQF